MGWPIAVLFPSSGVPNIRQGLNFQAFTLSVTIKVRTSSALDRERGRGRERERERVDSAVDFIHSASIHRASEILFLL